MRRIDVYVLTAIMAMSLCACGKKDSDKEKEVTTQEASSTEATTEDSGDNSDNSNAGDSSQLASQYPGYYIQTAGMPTESISDTNIGFVYTELNLNSIDIGQLYGYKASKWARVSGEEFDSLPTLEELIEQEYDSRNNIIYIYDKEISNHDVEYDKYDSVAEIVVDSFDSGSTYKDSIDNNFFHLYTCPKSETFSCDTASDMITALFENAGAPDEFFILKDIHTDFEKETSEQVAYALFNTPANEYRAEGANINFVYYAMAYKMDNEVVVIRFRDEETKSGLEVHFVDYYVVPANGYENFKEKHINDNGEVIQVSSDDIKNALQ